MVTMTPYDLELYLAMITRAIIRNEVAVKHHGATDMSQKLNQAAIQAMAQHHSSDCNHHFVTKPRIIGNSMEYFGECRYCGEKDA